MKFSIKCKEDIFLLCRIIILREEGLRQLTFGGFFVDRRKNDFVQIPVNIFKDKRLNSQDISLLVSFFFLQEEERGILKVDIEGLINRLDISKNQFEFTLKRLVRLNWVKVDDSRDITDNSLELFLNIPEPIQDPYNQPGSKIAKNWYKYFGNRLIRYEDVQELKRFVIDGMEEDLVLKIMEYSGLKAENPFYYAKAVLLDLYSRGIMTLDDYNEQEGKCESSHDQHFSGNYRRKEKRDTGKNKKVFREEDYR